MKLELSQDEAHFLSKHLTRHIAEVENELVHTDKRQLQRDLARDLEHLRAIERQLVRLMDADEAAA
jgi:hypothetical protein